MPRPNAPRVDAAQRDAQALELRAAGATYRQIAQRLGVSVSTAHECVTRGLDRTRREPAEQLRELELERLDRLQVEATKVLAARHVIVQAGKVVVDEDTRQPAGSLIYALVTGYPEREAGELVFVADLTGELRAGPHDTWAKLGVDPD